MSANHFPRKFLLWSVGTAALLLAVFFTIYGISARRGETAPLQPVVYEIIPVSPDGIPLLAEYNSRNMSLMESGDISSQTVRIYENGLCQLTVTLAIWNDPPELIDELVEIAEQAHVSFMLSQEDLSGLTAYLKNADLEMLPPDVSRQGADGYSAYLTVYLDQRKYHSGGYLADGEQFNAIVSKIWSYVGQEFSELHGETAEKVMEATGRAYVN